jgi:hypothetical protein
MTSNSSLDFGFGTLGQVLTSNGPAVAPTFQNQSGALTVGYESTYYYQLNYNGTVSTTIFQVVSGTNIFPFFISHPTRFDSLTYNVVAQQSSNIRFGIYYMDGFATTLFKELGTGPGTPTGVKTVSIDVSLNVGWWGMAIQGASPSPRLAGVGSTIASSPWLPVGTAYGTTTPTSLLYTPNFAAGFSDFSALTPTLVTTSTPIISLRVV